MKIASWETVVVALPPAREHPMAFGDAQLGRYVIVAIETDNNIRGYGEATVLPLWGGDRGRYYGELAETTVILIEEVLGPAVQGMDPFAIQAIHKRMDQAVKGYAYAKSAVEVAIFDILGKALEVPVYQLLGGMVRRDVPVAHSLGILEVSEMVKAATMAVEEGIRTIKCKVGLDMERDIEAVSRVRQAVGPSVDIVVDGNQGYRSPKEAVQALLAMAAFGIRYAEQPVEGIRQMAEVVRRVNIPIMADESAWNMYDVLELERASGADMISLYVTKPGGLYPAKEMAAVASAAGFPCNVNGSAETGVGNAANLHLAASTAAVTEPLVIPVTTLKGREQTEIAGVFYGDDIVKDPFEYHAGCLRVPDSPGLGIELDPEKVKRYRVD